MNFRRYLLPTILLLLILAIVGCSQDEDSDGDDDGQHTPVSEAEQISERGGEPVTDDESEPTATPTVTPVPSATPTPTRVPTGPVTICMAQEPSTLYLYGPNSQAAQVVRQVIYDGPIDSREYELQPVILEKLPSLADGDARLTPVTVGEGDRVVDNEGNVVRLRDGVIVRPAGCYGDECAVVFADEEPPAGDEEEHQTVVGSLEMEQLEVTFVLLEDVRWSDGEQLTASDSVFSYELAQEATIPPRQRTGGQGLVPERRVDPIERTASYTAVDEHTVRWVGLPGAMDPYYQGNFFIPLPQHQLEGLLPEQLMAAEESARYPLGWGPYVLTEWTAGERIVAERNPEYFRAGEDLPYFDQVIFRFAGDDPQQFVDDLVAGECDVVTGDALHNDWAVYEALAGDGVVLHARPSAVSEQLVFGINPVAHYDWRGDIFEDARLRQAVAYCVDRGAIMDELMGGHSRVPDAFVPPDHPLYAAAELVTYDYDPERGRALLQEMGWRDTNGDGIAEAYGIQGVVEGDRLIFNYTTTSSALRGRIAQMVVDNLSQCGFRVDLPAEPLAPETFFSTGNSSPIFGRTFDMTSMAWFADMLPPCHLYTTSQTPAESNGWSGFNVSGYSNGAYDAACQRAQGRIEGMDGYEASHVETLQIFNQDLPAVPLFMHLQAALATEDLEGLELDPTMPFETWNVENFRRAGANR
ncbi:MAG TPA: ABC transporter substrate-binding protein [Candidatus Sulfomarinibacteraceae bacterium]|nr:ABC transporter substrate-binding protein [Candidatus Sulfomarinibacteraceae bacterium]